MRRKIDGAHRDLARAEGGAHRREAPDVAGGVGVEDIAVVDAAGEERPRRDIVERDIAPERQPQEGGDAEEGEEDRERRRKPRGAPVAEVAECHSGSASAGIFD
jgi:hypothetical protein